MILLIGIEIDSLYLSLKSGFLLCELMNKFFPGVIPRISKPKTKWRASALPERVRSFSHLIIIYADVLGSVVCCRNGQSLVSCNVTGFRLIGNYRKTSIISW